MESDVWRSLSELNSVDFRAVFLPPVSPIATTTEELSSSTTEFATRLISLVLQLTLDAHFSLQIFGEWTITYLHPITGSLWMLVCYLYIRR